MHKLCRSVRFSVSISALMTLLVGLGLTALLFASVRRVESERHNVQFQQSARLRLRNGDAASLSGLHGHRFVDGKQQRAAIHDSYHVVDYIEPMAGNEAALGLDTAITGPGPRQITLARQWARRGHQLAPAGAEQGLAHRVPGGGPGVSARGAARYVAARHRAVIGETAAVFQVDHLIDTILGPGGFLNVPGMAVSIYAGPSADAKTLASRHGAVPLAERTLERLSIETDLRHALERGEFAIHYQPQVSLSSGRIVGMEALIRWDHPVHGLIPPARFIGLAEEMGLIIPICAWVIRTACIQTKAWQQAGLGDLRVAVNLSPRQFTQKTLVQSIADVLHATGLEPRYLELELTESMVMSDVDNAIAILRSLKGLGVHISIDDFGTGYSCLSYLRRFPIDVLKIDQSFVNDLTVNADDAAIVVSIISLAHSLRLQVIAEGVETAEQLAFLRKHGCDQMQGYYFSRPIEADAFELMLQQGSCWPSQANA